MKKVIISMLALSAIIVVLNAQDPAQVPYVASVKKNAGGFGGQIRIAPGNISVNGMPAHPAKGPSSRLDKLPAFSRSPWHASGSPEA